MQHATQDCSHFLFLLRRGGVCHDVGGCDAALGRSRMGEKDKDKEKDLDLKRHWSCIRVRTVPILKVGTKVDTL